MSERGASAAPLLQRPRVRAVTPLLVVSNLQRSIDFYVQVCGYRDPTPYGDPPCFAMLHRDGFDLMLSLGSDTVPVRPNGPAGVWDVYVTVVDLDQELQALRASGVTPERGPTDTAYGMREIELLDPDGYRLCFAQDTSGPWPDTEFFEGVLDLGSTQLRLVLKIACSGQGWVGALDSPDQGVSNLPLDVVLRDEGRLRFEIKPIGATFEGTFEEADGSVRGQWDQSGRSRPLRFRKA